MELYHYYDQRTGPFRNLSHLPDADADAVLEQIAREKPDSFCARRSADYMKWRRYYEAILREIFVQKGGVVRLDAPHYMVVGPCPWLMSWYEQPACLHLPIEAFDLRTVSFTYGDSHPTFSKRVNDGRPYRKQLYTYEEILRVMDRYGLPQEWNDDGRYGPERYIEAHIWSDEALGPYLEGRR